MHVQHFQGMEMMRIFPPGGRILLARADERTIRERNRHILEVCQPGGGFCLGSGNWVISTIPPDNYLAMHDGRAAGFTN